MAEAPTTTDAAQIDADETARVAGAYFGALARRDVEAAVALWKPGGREHVRGQVDALAPDGVREFIGGLFASFPDFLFDVVETTVQDDRAAVRWRATATFAGAPFNGIEPTGARIEIEGIDVLIVRGGLIVENNAVADGMSLARQVGLLPPVDSAMEQRMTRAFNAKTRVARRLTGGKAEPIADGVWRLQGNPGRCNVYFVRDGAGVLMFDAGAKVMRRAVARAAAELGGLTRIVLGHGHTDHRGTAPFLGVPILCHPDEVVDAEGSGGFRYWDPELKGLPAPHRQVQKLLHHRAWDGGPVAISGTVSEGDDVAGFEVVHLPGHAPGLIALWRASDRLALTSDAFYTLDSWARDTPPHLPFAAYNFDTEQARASLRKLAALEPAAAWPGHANPVTGDVRAQLEQAAAAPA